VVNTPVLTLSREESHVMSEQLDILKLVAERLERVGVAYMMSGSIALSYYAEPRLTRDIDMVVELRSDDAERLTCLRLIFTSTRRLSGMLLSGKACSMSSTMSRS
jgi:hypothetical protein